MQCSCLTHSNFNSRPTQGPYYLIHAMETKYSNHSLTQTNHNALSFVMSKCRLSRVTRIQPRIILRAKIKVQCCFASRYVVSRERQQTRETTQTRESRQQIAAACYGYKGEAWPTQCKERNRICSTFKYNHCSHHKLSSAFVGCEPWGRRAGVG